MPFIRPYHIKKFLFLTLIAVIFFSACADKPKISKKDGKPFQILLIHIEHDIAITSNRESYLRSLIKDSKYDIDLEIRRLKPFFIERDTTVKKSD